MDPTNDTTYDNIFDEQWIPQLNEKDYYSSKETRTATNHIDQENTEKKKRSLEDEEDEIEEKELFPWLFDQNVCNLHPRHHFFHYLFVCLNQTN